MAKLKTFYVCSECSHETPKWIGKCAGCGAWNSYVEDVKESKTASPLASVKAVSIKKLNQGFTSGNIVKLKTNISEFDQVLGGGIVPGSLILLSGEPGIGKSTLTLQIAGNLALQNKKVILVSGEEAVSQVGNRARRLGVLSDNLFAVNEVSLESIIETIRVNKPSFVVIDSIQVIASEDLSSNSGSISQVRYCTEKLMELANSMNLPILLIGHVTKDGNLAGPRVLEHLVDVVLNFEGDRLRQFRLLRAVKNRYGSCFEVGVFEMTGKGLFSVENPAASFLNERNGESFGSVITTAMEGTRGFMVEVQALVSTSPFGYPKRTSNGFDLNRLQLLIAVLEKYGKLNLQNQDVFVNVVGGIRLNEPAADLAVLVAIVSSLLKRPISSGTAVYGEVGLSGEVRSVSFLEKRKADSKKMGFENVVTYSKGTSTVLNVLTKLFPRSE